MNAHSDLVTSLEWPANLNEIPKAVFDDPDLYKMELEKIFYGPEWHVVAHRGEVPEKGDFKRFYLGEMPILVIHGEDGQVRVFHNSCSHRGAIVETKNRGNQLEFECPYHRWLFSSTGDMIGCPNSEQFSPGFKKEDFGLIEIRTDEYCGLVFATLSDETPDLKEWMGERMLDPLARILGGDGRLRLLGYQKVNYACNWKAYVDNDGYHAPLLHPAFKLLNWQGGHGSQTPTENGHIVFEADLTMPDKVDLLDDPSLIEFRGTDTSNGSLVISAFPITVFTKHLDMINIRFAFPRDNDHTEVHYAYFAHEDDDEEMARHRLRQASNLLGPSGMISLEDAAIFTRIHHGNISPGNAIFQKGVTDPKKLNFHPAQNDETGNLPRWEYYRKLMGFRRAQS